MKTNNFLQHGMPLAAAAIFPLVWYFTDIYYATAALMAVFAAQVAALAIARQPISKQVWTMFCLVIGMGALTLLLRDKAYIQIKTSVVYGGFAATLLIFEFIARRSLPQLLLGKLFVADAAVWRNISVALAAYFAALSLCNWVVLTYFSEAVWVGVKTFGFPVATLCFTVLMVVYLARRGAMVDDKGETS